MVHIWAWMSCRSGLGEGSAAASKASSVSMRSKVMRWHKGLADCAGNEWFLGFLGWFSARSDRLMWSTAKSRPKSRVKQKSVV